MKIIKGTYNTAKIFTDVIEPSAEEQVAAMCNFAPFADSKIRIMPDVHAGAGCTIGTTMTVGRAVVPAMVGVDIGCGMFLAKLKEREINFAALDNFIRNNIPSGLNVRNCPHSMAEFTRIDQLICRDKADLDLARRSVGTLGGGNHFIEVDRDEDGRLYLVIHSGSRHLGTEVAKYYQGLAYASLCAEREKKIREVAASFALSGNTDKIPAAVAAVRAEYDIPRDMAYLTGENLENYLHDMYIVQAYAGVNRRAIAGDIMRAMGLTVADSFTTIHNYIDTESGILRKGAVSARFGERLLIPINMRDGSLICRGLGNPDWNYSAPHGAGRILSRGEAKAKLTVEEFREQMQGIYTTSVGADTLDESPMAYKRLKDIEGNITETAEIVRRIVPVYNFKASGDVRPWNKKNA